MSFPSVHRSRQGALPRTVDVVVAGGGAIGASVACWLADGGASVLLVEAFTLPDGADPTHFSGAPRQVVSPVPLAGRPRTRTTPDLRGTSGRQEPDPAAAERAFEALARRSADLYADLPTRPWAAAGHRAASRASLHLLPDEVLLAAYTDAVAQQAARGLDSMMIRPEDAAVLNPYVASWQYAGAALVAPERWHVSGSAAADLLAVAADRGAQLREHCMVERIEQQGGAVSTVWTDRGSVRTGAVVLCAGVHTSQLAEAALPGGAGSDGPPGPGLPLTARRRAFGFTLPLAPRPGQVPTTLDVGSTFWFANAEPDRMMLGVERPDRRLDPGYESRLLPVLRQAAAHSAPALSEAPLAPGWSGTRTETPDGIPLLGSNGSGLLYATGFGGSAARVAPAVGEVVRDLLEQSVPDIDATPFGVERFW
ncbi:FAD-dependent oxidoreductase [Myceligenerans cantabricum]